MSERIQAIHAAIEFIDSHLKEDITVADIAAAAGYSLYHFIRTFNQVVRHTPYNYLMRRRLSEAARDLADTDARILDISLAYRFNNHETFSRAFKRMFGIQPSQWREPGLNRRNSLMPKLSLDYLEFISQTGSLRPDLVEREEVTLLGLATQDQENLPHLWASLDQALREIPLPQGPRSFYGVSSHLQNQSGTSFYFAGVEINEPGSYPPPLVIQILPKGTYARFVLKGPSDQIPLLMAYIQYTWLPQSDYRMVHPIEIACYTSIQGNAPDSAAIIYIPIEKFS